MPMIVNKDGKPYSKRDGDVFVGDFRDKGYLADAIFNYHKLSEDLDEALSYLEKRLDRFKDKTRCDDIISQFLWYVDEFGQRGWPAFQTRLNIEIPLSAPAPSDLKCSGQVSRVDIIPTGGYMAWLFRSKDYQNWFKELQMPLIQDTLSQTTLHCPLYEVGIGIYSFEESYVSHRSFSSQQVQNAWITLRQVLHQMGY